MKRKFFYMIILFSIFSMSTACNKTKDKDSGYEQLPEFKEKETFDYDSKLVEKINKMTLKEKIGQLLIIGFEGTTMNEDIENYIKNYKVGGFIFFARNIDDSKQSIKLVNDIKTKNRVNNVPLFIAIDEEGGRINRLPDELKKLPSAKIIGDIDQKEVTLEYGKLMGDRLVSLGFNLNFAPVLDINSNPNNPVIGDRAFGDTEAIVTRNGIATMQGLREREIIAGVKHFPGHGDTEIDSHMDLPIINKDLKALKELELLPFKRAIKEQVDMIMLGHILYKNIDKDYPATMSKPIIENLLKNELGFEGVVISDDITMGAVLKNYRLEDASIKFLNSGGDILLICHGRDNPRLISQALEKAINSKVINKKNIDEKVYRILKLKEKYKLNDKLLKEANVKELNEKIETFLKNKIN